MPPLRGKGRGQHGRFRWGRRGGGVGFSEAEFLAEFSGLQGSLDYMDPAVVLPVFLPAPELFYFLCTFGLDGAAGEFPGGYWPEARVGKVAEGFPKRPWAPLVLWGEGGALALAPGELFPTSPFVPWGEGFGRALPGLFSPEVSFPNLSIRPFRFGPVCSRRHRSFGAPASPAKLPLGKEERRVRMELPLSNNFLVWDPWRKELTSDLIPIPPEGLAYRVLFPVRKGIGLLWPSGPFGAGSKPPCLGSVLG